MNAPDPEAIFGSAMDFWLFALKLGRGFWCRHADAVRVS
jgi:hypothetical protein